MEDHLNILINLLSVLWHTFVAPAPHFLMNSAFKSAKVIPRKVLVKWFVVCEDERKVMTIRYNVTWDQVGYEHVSLVGRPWAERSSLIKMAHGGALSEYCRWKVSMGLTPAVSHLRLLLKTKPESQNIICAGLGKSRMFSMANRQSETLRFFICVFEKITGNKLLRNVRKLAEAQNPKWL